MKYEDLLRMARAANVPASWELNWYDPYLDRFADIVTAETLSNIDPSRFMSYQEGFEAGAAAEREACAGLCDGLADMHEKMNQWSQYKTAETLAQAIRARGETK